MAARPNEQPIKGRVRPFRESPAGIPPGEEENLGEAVYVAETKTGGGQFSRKRNVPRLLEILPSNSRKKNEKDLCALNFPRWMENIFKFPPSTELYYRSNEILKNSIRTSAATLETSKLVIDFSFTWVIVSSREVYCTRSYLTPFGGCLSNRLAGSRSWLTFQRSYIVRNYRGSVEYRGTIKSQRTIFPLISLSLYSNPQQQQQWF